MVIALGLFSMPPGTINKQPNVDYHVCMPEHIGDTFLWMKRSDKGPNTLSQVIKDLEPGRLYSMKMFSCDYADITNPKTKKREEHRVCWDRVARQCRTRYQAIIF